MSLSMIFVAALVVGAAANASEPADSTFDRLMKVDKFAFGGIGEGGDISQGEQDFNVILSRRSALADFVRLYSNGDRKSTRLNSSHLRLSRMPSSA